MVSDAVAASVTHAMTKRMRIWNLLVRKATERACRPGVVCVTNVHRLCIEAVPEAADVEEVARPGRVVFQFSSQADDMVVDHAVVQRDVGPPCGIEKLIAGQESSPRAHER